MTASFIANFRSAIARQKLKEEEPRPFLKNRISIQLRTHGRGLFFFLP